MSKTRAAILALEDGSIFHGKAFGADKTITGEAVFNTSMTGYQEIVTDPSYCGQIVTLTATQIGNYGINPDDAESDKPQVWGLVIRELSPITSNWRSKQCLNSYLKEHAIPGIEGVDTRTITRTLREHGALKACLSTEDISEEDAVAKAREWHGLEGIDYIKDVTCKQSYTFEATADECAPFTVSGTNIYPQPTYEKRLKIAAIDFGAKKSIFKKLLHHGFDITVFPADVKQEEIDAEKPDGLFLSNGPGDPSAVPYAHETVRQLIDRYPTFGICMGHQILTHAIGAKTFKLKFGHRGGNQPVKNIETGHVAITAQNHGFASTREELEGACAIVTEVNLNDDTVAGLRLKDKPVFSVQYHPEAAPGPNDAVHLFQKFREVIESA